MCGRPRQFVGARAPQPMRNCHESQVNKPLFKHGGDRLGPKTICGYNIASRATQSNSVYVSVLQISIVHSRADGVSKSLCQKFFFARAAIVSAGQNIMFRDNKKYRDSAHQSQNEDNFPTFSLGLEFLKERKTTEKETWHQSRHDSLHCPRVKCNKF